MPRTYRVRQALIGSIYDAQRHLNEGRTRDAYELLRKRIKEIEKADKEEWHNTDWN